MGKRVRKIKQHTNKNDMRYLQEVIDQNGGAMRDGPKRKTWSTHDMKRIQPLTENQHDLFSHYFSGAQVCAYGSAGTGKTFIALWLALNDVLNPDSEYTRLVIVRSAVATRDIGHLPGSLDEKIALYELPYKDILGDLFGRASTYDDMKAAGIIEFMPTSFIRGLTWNDAIVVVDEIQNMTIHELDSIITRVGENTRIILCGDVYHQCDLKRGEETGARKVVEILKKMDSFEIVEFTTDDIVRSKLVKEWIIARNSLTS